MWGLIVVFATICLGTAAWASPLAVLRSDRGAETYHEQHLGNFDEDWLSFKQTLEAANVRYDLLNDASFTGGKTKLSVYKVVIVPMLLDLTPDEVFQLTEYTKGGGKLLVTDGGGQPSQSAQAIMHLIGVESPKHT